MLTTVCYSLCNNLRFNAGAKLLIQMIHFFTTFCFSILIDPRQLMKSPFLKKLLKFRSTDKSNEIYVYAVRDW